MRWTAFAVFAFVFVVLEVSLAGVLELRTIGVRPSFVPVLVVFVSLFAPRITALWGCWVLGIVVDVSTDIPHGELVESAAPLIGPNALGYVAACLVVLRCRAMLLRGRSATMAVMTVVSVVAIYLVHGLYPADTLHWADFDLGPELLRRLGVAAYSGLTALVIGRLLLWTLPLWTFRTPVQRSVSWR